MQRPPDAEMRRGDAIAVALKEAAHEADRALTNRLQADHARRGGGAA